MLDPPNGVEDRVEVLPLEQRTGLAFRIIAFAGAPVHHIAALPADLPPIRIRLAVDE